MTVHKPNTRVIRSERNSKVSILWEKRDVSSWRVVVFEGLGCAGNVVGRGSLS